MLGTNPLKKPLVQQEDVIRHNCNVSQLSTLIATQMKLDILETRRVACSAMYHDIGKGLINQEILYKPGKLTKQEFEEIKKHTAKGAEYMKKNRHLRPFADYILFHHENFDGTGYYGLKGESIPLVSRIIRAGDYFDALCEDRPYRDKMTMNQAIEIIIDDSKVFDPNVLKALLELNEEKRLGIVYAINTTEVYQHAAF